MITWINGALVEDPTISAQDRGFTLGDGIFETIAVRAGLPLCLDRHLARLRDGAAVLGLTLAYDDRVLTAAMAAVLAGQGLGEGSVRLTVTRGPAPRGLLPPAEPHPTMLITAAPAAARVSPARLVVATVTRRNEHSPLARIKSLNALDNILARQEAAQRDADDAILLNTRGRVAETTVANLFAVIDGALVTPPVADGALPGITRHRVLAAKMAVERSLHRHDLDRASAVVLTNSLGLRAAVSLDGRPLAEDGAVLAGLHRLYRG